MNVRIMRRLLLETVRLTIVIAACGFVAAITSCSARAGAAICKSCLEANNDTTFTPGKSAEPREFVGGALQPFVGFIGADLLLHAALPSADGWQVEIVSPFPIDGGCSVALDGAGRPWIAAHDPGGTLFIFHRNDGGGWIDEPVDPASIVAGTPSLVTFPPNGIGIAFFDQLTGTLKYGERAGVNPWTTDIVTPVANRYYRDPCLVVDGGVPAISYCDGRRGDLLLAQRFPGGWVSAPVDTDGSVGGYSSLVGGPSRGGWGIAYYDFGNADLKYAESNVGGWTLTTIDGANARVGRFASAVLFGATPHDHIGIGYYDETHGDLKYAQKNGPAWTVTVQDTVDDVGTSVSCAASPSPADTVGFVYIDRTEGDLLYQYHAGTLNAVPRPGGPAAALHLQWLRAPNGAGGKLRFSVPAPGPVLVTFFDAAGRTVASPLRGTLPAGPAEAGWDGRDASGHRVRAGVFFARVETAGGAAAVPAVVMP